MTHESNKVPKPAEDLQVELLEPEPNAPRPSNHLKRHFHFEDKLRIVLEAESTPHGKLGALLRRENLYFAQFSEWRNAYREHGEEGLRPKKLGRPMISSQQKQLQEEVRRLQLQNVRLQSKYDQAKLIIEVQKKLCEMLGLPTSSTEIE